MSDNYRIEEIVYTPSECFVDGFHKELEELINRYSKENGSNTPDFILASYMKDTLAAFDKATKARETWYGR